jgi:predicted lipoprotein with Yx(FWY)xxD motif
MMTEESIAKSSGAEEPQVVGVRITTADSEFGQILFDDTGQAIYLFDKEVNSVPDCYDACAAAWPPVLTEGVPVPGDGVTPDLLGTVPRSDGSIQVTYAGHPLYYYADEGQNEVTCHNVDEFGGLWLVVTPTGQPAD